MAEEELLSSSSSTADELLSSSSTGEEWWNSSSSSSTGVAPVFALGSMPNGLVPYGCICFIGVTVFTAILTWYYARPKLPPMVGILTFLAWSVESFPPLTQLAAC
jgi:hypothetical protein